MANRYWVGNSGNWSDASNHWAITSGGSGAAGNLPTIADNVYFNALSFDASGTIIMDVSGYCNNFDWTGLDSSVYLRSTNYGLALYGDVSLNSNLYFNFSGTSLIYLLGQDSSKYIRTNGCIFKPNSLWFESSTSTWISMDHANYGNTNICHSNGTWNTNGYDVSTSGYYAPNNNPFNGTIGVKTLKLGSSNFYCATFSPYNSWSGFTLDASNSTLYTAYVTSYGPITLNNVILTFTSSVRIRLDFGYITYNNLTYIAPSGGPATLSIVYGSHQVNGKLTLVGVDSSYNRLTVLSSALGTPMILKANDVSAVNVDFRDISTGGNWDLSSAGGGSGDCGGNNGIIFTPSSSCYLTHTSGTAYWHDVNKWKNIDRITNTRVPLPQDNIVIDVSSTTGYTDLILGNSRFKNIDVSTIFPVNLYYYLGNVECYGNVFLGSNTLQQGTYATGLYNPNLTHINIQVPSFKSPIYFRGGGSSYIFDNKLDSSSSLNAAWMACSMDFNDQNITVNMIDFRGANSVKMGNGTVTVTDCYGYLYLSNVDGENGTLILRTVANQNRMLHIDMSHLNNVIIDGSILFSIANTNSNGRAWIKQLTINPGATATFVSKGTSSFINYFIDKLYAIGTNDKPIIWKSSASGSYHNLFINDTSTSIRTQFEHCIISDCCINIPKRYYANNSIDQGNNTNIIFKEFSIKPIRIGNKIIKMEVETPKYKVVTNGLMALYDAGIKESFTGAINSTIYDLSGNRNDASIITNVPLLSGLQYLGTNRVLRLDNSRADNGYISFIKCPSLSNITTVSLCYYQNSFNAGYRYILDMRVGGAGGYIADAISGGAGSNWYPSGKLYMNGSLIPSGIVSTNYDTLGWKLITLVASVAASDDINLFSRYTDNYGLDSTFVQAAIYNRELTANEVMQNYLAIRSRI